MKERIVSNAVFRVIERLVNIALVLILTPFLIRELGQEAYGLWILILSVTGWFMFLDLGFSSAVQRQLAIFIEGKNLSGVSSLFSCALVLFSVIGAIAALGVACLGVYPEVIGIGDDYKKDASTAILILSFKVLWDFVMCAFFGFYSGSLRQDADAIISTLNTITKSVLVFILVPELLIYGAVLATMLADLVFNTVKILYCKKIFPGFRFRFSYLKLNEFQSLFAFSKHVALNILAKTINKRIDPLVIAKIMDLQKVAVYSVASKLIMHIEAMINAVLGFALPVFARLIIRKGDIENEFNQIVSLNFFFAISFLAPLIVMSKWFLFLWLGEEFQKAAALINILAFVSIVYCISRPINQLLMASACHKTLSLVNLVGAGLNLSLSIALGLRYGLAGVAVATLISSILNGVIMHLYLLKRYMDYSIKVQIKGYFLANLLLFIAFSTAQWFYSISFYERASLLEFVYTAISIMAVFSTIAFFVFLPHNLRRTLVKLLLTFILRRKTA